MLEFISTINDSMFYSATRMRLLMKAFKTAITITTATTLLLISTNPLYADLNIPAKGPISFELYDIDRDGSISKDEFDQIRAKRLAQKSAQGRGRDPGTKNRMLEFKEFDIDKNGSLSRTELESGRQKMRDSNSNQRKKNSGKGQGNLSNRPSFKDFDINGNGNIDEVEFNKAHALRMSERAKQNYRMKNAGKMASFKDIDSDNDGLITPEEFSKHQTTKSKSIKNN